MSKCAFLQNKKKVSDQHRPSREVREVLYLEPVYEKDAGVFFCDTQIIEGGVTWTLRTGVEVIVIRKCCLHVLICMCIFVFLYDQDIITMVKSS